MRSAPMVRSRSTWRSAIAVQATRCQRVESLAQLLLLMDREVGGLAAALGDAAHDLVVRLEETAGRGLELDGLVDGAVMDAPGDGEGLDRMSRRAGPGGAAAAPIEDDRDVEGLVVSRDRPLPAADRGPRR